MFLIHTSWLEWDIRITPASRQIPFHPLFNCHIYCLRRVGVWVNLNQLQTCSMRVSFDSRYGTWWPLFRSSPNALYIINQQKSYNSHECLNHCCALKKLQASSKQNNCQETHQKYVGGNTANNQLWSDNVHFWLLAVLPWTLFEFIGEKEQVWTW